MTSICLRKRVNSTNNTISSTFLECRRRREGRRAWSQHSGTSQIATTVVDSRSCAAQPVKESHQHLQRLLLVGLYHSAHLLLANIRLFVSCRELIREREVLLLEGDGVVEGELRRAVENVGDGEVLVERAGEICEHEGEVVGEGLGEEGGEGGEGIAGADSHARDGAICEDENSRDGIEVLLDLIDDTLVVDLVLLKTASVGKTRGVEDTNLRRRRLDTVVMFTKYTTYHYAVLARKLVKTDQVRLTLVRPTMFVGMVEYIEVVVIQVITGKGVGDEFQD